MTIGKSGLIAAVLYLDAYVGNVAACNDAPFVETWVNQGTLDRTGVHGNCRLEARIATTADATASATAHYRRSDPQAPLTMTFRVDAPVASQAWNVLSIATLARGVARSTPAAGPDTANVFDIRLFGNVNGTSAVLGVAAACVSSPSGTCSATTAVAYSAFPLRVTIAFSFGAGTAGELKLWLGDNTTGSPAISLTNLDNIRWQGIERLGIGLLEASAGLRQRLAGQPIMIDQIGVSDPQIFVDGFDSNFAANVVPTVATPLATNTSYPGTTCGGSTKLTHAASGAASFSGPAAIYVLPGYMPPAGPSIRTIGVTSASGNLGIFLCPADAGPASNCMNAIGASSGPLPAQASMDDRRVVIAPVGLGPTGFCESFTLTVSGTQGAPAD